MKTTQFADDDARCSTLDTQGNIMLLQSVSPLRRQPYQGNRIDLVIGIDVGTTFSGVSYAILRPGEVPEVKPVTT